MQSPISTLPLRLAAPVRFRSGAKRQMPRGRGAPRGERQKRAPTLRLPQRTETPEALRCLSREVSRFTERSSTSQRLAGYGLEGTALQAALAQVPNRGRRAREDRPTTQLLRAWADTLPLTSVRKYESGGSPLGKLDAIAVDYDTHGADALTRACMSGFLAWLDILLQEASTASGAQDTPARISAVRSALTQLRLLRAATDLRAPAYAYGPARTLTRQIHLHVGPTNSGKTHGALVALSRARTGLYAGPLRLLAHEVWERLNEGTISPGIPPRACNLRTGEEQRMVDPVAGLVACTVEMADPSHGYDVAVVDEIQMLADLHRGYAWTQAVLGLAAKELHLCGEASAVPLVKQLAAVCGDHVHVHTYERLTPLRVAPESLRGDLQQIERGDCIVAFSRTAIFQLKQQIESQTQLQCAVAYGALPPEIKSEQAKLFNQGRLDVMVASDAIGMGLNLRIRRIVFDTLAKWNGREMVPLSVSQIKQIAGRAGRYGTGGAGQEGGLVLTKHEREMDTLRAALDAPLPPVTHAAIQPTSSLLESLSYLLPRASAGGGETRFGSRPLSALYYDVSLLAQVRTDLCVLSNFDAQRALSPIIELRSAGRLTHAEKERWANAPVNLRDERAVAWVGNAVELYARGELVRFEDCAEALGTLEAFDDVRACMAKAQARRDAEAARRKGEAPPLAALVPPEDDAALNVTTLMLLESHHRSLTLYLWLSFRFPLAFCFRAEADALKTQTEEAVEFCLEAIRVQRARRLAKLGRAHEVRPEHRHVAGVEAGV